MTCANRNDILTMQAATGRVAIMTFGLCLQGLLWPDRLWSQGWIVRHSFFNHCDVRKQLTLGRHVLFGFVSFTDTKADMRKFCELQKEVSYQPAVVLATIVEPVVASIVRAAHNITTATLTLQDTPQALDAVILSFIMRSWPSAAICFFPAHTIRVTIENVVRRGVIIPIA